jgi:hypothetical protein
MCPQRSVMPLPTRVRIGNLSSPAIWRAQAKQLADLVRGEPDQVHDKDHWQGQRFEPPQRLCGQAQREYGDAEDPRQHPDHPDGQDPPTGERATSALVPVWPQLPLKAVGGRLPRRQCSCLVPVGNLVHVLRLALRDRSPHGPVPLH